MAPRSKRDKQQESEPDTAQNGHDDDVASYEKELANLLNERIKPGLNRGAIPLLARSLAKEIATRQAEQDTSEDDAEYEDENDAEADDDFDVDGDDEYGDEEDSESPDLEADLYELQEQLGDDWILYFAVHGGRAWLTAEKEDASQRVEAPTASVLSKAVKLLNEGGGRFARRAARATR
jgi:hypothetical protein